MSGFIDPGASTKRRLDRIDSLLAQMLPLVPRDTFSPDVLSIVDDLLSEDALRQERARRRFARMEAESDPQ